MDEYQTPRFRRLPGLIPTEFFPHLGIPTVEEPGHSPAACDLDFVTCASCEALDEAHRLLQSTDTSFIYPLERQKQNGASSDTLLVKELLARDSNIFHVVTAAVPPKHALDEGFREEAAQLPEVSDSAADMASRSMSATTWRTKEAKVPVISVPPAAKRRRTEKTALASPAIPLQDPGRLQQRLEAFLMRAARVLQHEHNKEGDGDGELGTGDAELDGYEANIISEKDIRALSEEVAKAADVLHMVDMAVLSNFVKALRSFIEAGQGISLTTRDDEDTEAFKAVLLSLEASILGLHLMTAPSMPQQIYNEEAIGLVVEVLRKHLQTNVLAFYDARICHIHRPHLEDLEGYSDDENDSGGQAKKGKSKSQKKSQRGNASQVRGATKILLGRVEVALKLMSDLLGAVQLQGNLLVPLVRAVAQALTVEGLDVLQVQVIGLIAAAFKHYVAQRGAVLEEALTTVLPNLSSSKRGLRKFAVSEDDSLSIQMVSALILRMLQVSVCLPSSDTEASAMRDCFAPATHWADVIWSYCFDRFPTARAVKSDTEMDLKNLVEQIVDDLLHVHCLPQWPVAATALQRLVTMLGSPKGLGHSDSGVRQICVDLLSLVAAQLFLDAKQAEASTLNRSLLQQSADCDAQQISSSSREPEDALLNYLSSSYGVDPALTSSARQFMLCRSFVTEVSKLQRDGGSEDEIAAVLHKYRDRHRHPHNLGPDVEIEDAIDLAREDVLRGPLGKARFSLLKWLQDAMDPRQASTTRSKAVKALAAVMKVDSRLLAYQEVQACVTSALKDEAPSVKQAAVDLLGAHVSTSKDLALTYFDTVTAATRDASTSVRKSALKILWESCISVPGFSRASEACVHVLNRISDPEESIQDLVAKVFHALWFACKPEPGWEGASTTDRKVSDRARQLAEVSAANYDAGGAAIHIPLELAHPLVAILRKALEREKGASRHKAGSEISAALLEGVLSANDVPDVSAMQHKAAFPYLVALHAVSMSDLAFCIPKADPSRFVRCLAPYLKSSVDVKSDDEGQQRAEAEQLLCVLAILEALFQQLDISIAAVAAEVQEDLLKLVRTHAYTQVVSAACRTLSSLAKLAPAAGGSLTHLADLQLQYLQSFATNGINSQAHASYCQRYLFSLGYMFRYGGEVIRAAKLQHGTVTVDKALEACVQLYSSRGAGGKVQESALRAIGCLGIASPTALLGDSARSIMASALDRSAQLPLKVRALDNLAELLREDEERMTLLQQDSAEEKKGKKKRKAGKGKLDEVLATQNGQQDSLSLSSSILQEHWERVLNLATDTVPGECGVVEAGDARNARVRLSALAVMDLVDRNGLVAPWTSIPALMALATDPCRDAAVRAVRVLKRLAEKRPDMVQQRALTSGLCVTVDFHRRLQHTFQAVSPVVAEAPVPVLYGFSTLFADVFQPVRTLKAAFLNMLLQPFEAACQLHTGAGGGGAAANLWLLAIAAHVAAELLLKRGDEVCTVVHQINGIISRRSEDVMAAVEDVLALPEEDCARAPKEALRALQVAWKQSVAVCMLLVLKTFLINTYGLTVERVAAFQPSGEKRKAEEKLPVTRAAGHPLHLNKISLEPPSDASQLRKHYAIFKALTKADAANYRQGGAAGQVEVEGRENGAQAPSPPGMSTPAWVKGSTALSRKTSLGSRGVGPRRKSNLGTKSSLGKSGSRGKKPGKRRKQRAGSSESESEEVENDDDDYVITTTKSRRQLEPMLRV